MSNLFQQSEQYVLNICGLEYSSLFLCSIPHVAVCWVVVLHECICLSHKVLRSETMPHSSLIPQSTCDIQHCDRYSVNACRFNRVTWTLVFSSQSESGR